MSFSIEQLMEKLARFQVKHPKAIAISAVFLTLLLSLGLPNIHMETDFTKELPQDLPIIKLDDRVSETFGGEDVILLVAQLEYGVDDPDAVRDIRDPRVMEMLIELEDSILDETEVSSVQSIGSAFRGREQYLTSLDSSKAFLSNLPQSEMSFNRDYSATVLYSFANLGSDEDAVKRLEEKIAEDMSQATIPPGVRVRLTGTPSIRSELMDILQSDAIFTISLAAAVILLLLVAISKPRSHGLLIFIPLVLGLTWTLGCMGWANIPLSVATVGIGAMILGLGVEYGVFYVSRYFEEREKDRGQADSLRTALVEVGSAIVGSSLTTIVGFLALLFASMPMLHHLGISLAFGIFCCVLSALVVNPALIVLVEDISRGYYEKKFEKISNILENGGKK